MNITIHTICYNEELILPKFIDHYRSCFPDCKIIIYDNESTDKSIQIGQEKKCEVITYKTNNKLCDKTYLDIKNNCWKESETDWNIVCDCDELLFINEKQLLNEELNGVMIVKPIGYSLMNNTQTFDLNKLNMGFRDVLFDKCVLFNKKYIKEINFSPGCHSCNPQTVSDFPIKYNTNDFKLVHFKYLSPEYTINRYKMFGERLSENNKKYRWGIHYQFTSQSIKKWYDEKQKDLIKIL